MIILLLLFKEGIKSEVRFKKITTILIVWDLQDYSLHVYWSLQNADHHLSSHTFVSSATEMYFYLI